MQEKKGAELIVDYLIRQRSPYMIGLCGHGDVSLMDAAFDRKDEISIISTHNEQTAGFMADAYYRVSGQPVATFTSCGPGSVSIQAAIACAMADSSPIFAITGNIPTQQFNRSPFQELGHHQQADFTTAMRPYVKRSFQATRPDMLPRMLPQAWKTMLTGRAGPVHLDVPFNVFEEKTAVTRDETDVPVAFAGLRSQGAPDSIRKAVDLLLAAERPLILAGYGVTLGRANAQLLRLAELLNVPVASTPQGKGALDESHRLALGATGRDGAYPANRASRGCDVLLALATRFGDRGSSAWSHGATHSIPPTKLIHVDHDAAAIGRSFPTEVGIIGDVALVIEQIIAEIEQRSARRADSSAWQNETAKWVEHWYKDLAQTKVSDDMPIHPDRFIADLQSVTPDDAIVVSDIGLHHSWLVQQWKTPARGRLLQSGAFASMGFGVAGALGAQLAAPDRPVIAVVGDGGFMMHANAIATAVEYDLPVVWVVWNNCGYVSIRDMQIGFFGREVSTRFRHERSGELISADYALMAQAMGAQGFRVERPQDLADQVKAALASRKPAVLDVRMQADAKRRTSGTWDMPPLKGSAPSYDPYPLK